MELLPHLEVNPEKTPEASVIWLHGLGADGHDFEPLVPALSITRRLPIRFLFPHAPAIPVSVNGGYVMPAWYDIYEIQIERRVDEQQLAESAERVAALVEREIHRGVPENRIILAGFSQGGAVAYHLGLSGRFDLAGLLCLSTYLATPAGQPGADREGAVTGPFPVFIGHGDRDDIVPASLGVQAAEKLAALGWKVSLHRYPIEHTVSPQEVADIDQWLAEVLLTSQ